MPHYHDFAKIVKYHDQKKFLKIFSNKILLENYLKKRTSFMKKTMYVCMSPFCPPPPLITYVWTQGDVLSERSIKWRIDIKSRDSQRNFLIDFSNYSPIYNLTKFRCYISTLTIYELFCTPTGEFNVFFLS